MEVNRKHKASAPNIMKCHKWHQLSKISMSPFRITYNASKSTMEMLEIQKKMMVSKSSKQQQTSTHFSDKYSNKQMTPRASG